MPNAESALNEEAGKLLLEAYDDYAQRARLMTSIHASPSGEYKALLIKLGETDQNADTLNDESENVPASSTVPCDIVDR